jgi:hypothetical protein
MANGHGGARRRPARQKIVEVNQDGGNFYNEATGVLLFTSKQVEHDHDMDGAHAARVEFKVWCRTQDLRPIFERTP